MVDAARSSAAGRGQLDPGVDALGLERVGGRVDCDPLACLDEQADRVGQVELALGVRRLEPVERRPERGASEDVDRRVDLSQLQLVRRCIARPPRSHAARPDRHARCGRTRARRLARRRARSPQRPTGDGCRAGTRADSSSAAACRPRARASPPPRQRLARARGRRRRCRGALPAPRPAGRRRPRSSAATRRRRAAAGRAAGQPRAPSRRAGARGAGAGASASRSASACRGLRPSRLLRVCPWSRSAKDGWGARIRTWDHGTKTRCLTTWPRPSERKASV